MDRKAIRWMGVGMLLAIGVMLVIQQIPFLGNFALAGTILLGLGVMITSFVR
jgi:hypothetical protein